MASEPKRAPGSPALSGTPVKPESDALDRQLDRQSVPDSWLRDEENQNQADRLDRLNADYEWVNDLALAGFEGNQWDYFVNELARYGIGVIGGWMRSGLIWRRCQDRGLGGLFPMARPFTTDEIAEITGETVAKALYHFRVDVLMKKKWDYRRGATLRTYFVGQCLIRYANVYRRWLGNEDRHAYQDMVGKEEKKLGMSSLHSAPDRRAADRVIALEAMTAIKDPRVKKAMLMTEAGWTQAEIAIELGASVRAVERMLANQRDRFKKRGVA
jgi:hypothetical protein